MEPAKRQLVKRELVEMERSARLGERGDWCYNLRMDKTCIIICCITN
jgi:hypothetical protein